MFARPIHPTATAPTAGSLVMVDLIRFLCAAAVMASHYGTSFWTSPSMGTGALLAQVAPPAQELVVSTQFGWLGVELFFVISGMMIAQSARGSGAGRFLRRRVARLVPCAWICASATAAATLAIGIGDPDLPGRWLRSVLFWPTGPQIDPSYWTLGVELSFYLLVAARLRDDAGARLDALAAMLLGWSAAFWTAAVLCGPLVDGWSLDLRFQLALAPHGCLFALGIVIARAQEGGWTVRRQYLGAGAFIVCLAEIASHAADRAAGYGLDVAPAIPILAFGGGVVLLILAPALQPAAARWISPERARAVGLATYPLYLIHQDAGAILTVALSRAGLGTSAALALSAVVVVAFAWTVAHWLEPPMRTLLDRALDRLSSRGPEPDTPRIASPLAG
jgi:peptidoglycan/LPS O-acetylase OafA/YrhL